MALASTAFAFYWSKWNSEASRGKFVVRAAECTSKQNTEQVCALELFSGVVFWSCFPINFISALECFALAVNLMSEVKSIEWS